MSLNLLGQYDSSDSDTPTISDAPTRLPTTGPQHKLISIDNQGLSDTEGKGRSYFDQDFSDEEYSESDDNIEDSSSGDSDTTKDSTPLPLPTLERIHTGKVEVVPGSVFSNPYKEVEDAKLAVLKKHVALAPTEEPIEERKKKQFNRRKRKEFIRHGDGGEDDSNNRGNFKKVKVGLSGGLVPSNKYMKLHQKQQANERPWTIDNN